MQQLLRGMVGWALILACKCAIASAWHGAACCADRSDGQATRMATGWGGQGAATDEATPGVYSYIGGRASAVPLRTFSSRSVLSRANGEVGSGPPPHWVCKPATQAHRGSECGGRLGGGGAVHAVLEESGGSRGIMDGHSILRAAGWRGDMAGGRTHIAPIECGTRSDTAQLSWDGLELDCFGVRSQLTAHIINLNRRLTQEVRTAVLVAR